LRKHTSINESFFTTRTVESVSTLEGRRLRLIPSAAYCYIVGRNITNSLKFPVTLTEVEPDDDTDDDFEYDDADLIDEDENGGATPVIAEDLETEEGEP
jgi:hypothetical protein